MLRLLLPKQKKELRAEYRNRFLVVFFGSLTCVVLAWGFSLVPTYVTLQSEEKVLREDLRIATDPALNADRNMLKDELQSLSKRLVLLDVPSYQVSRLLQLITNAQTRAIAITTISFDATKNPTDASLQGVLVLSGVANTRSGLMGFADTLKQQADIFTDVDLPFSSLVKDTDIPFTITIQLTPVLVTAK